MRSVDSRNFYWIPLVPAALLLLAYSVVGTEIAWVGTGFTSRIQVWTFFPALAFPLFLLIFVSLRAAAIALTLYVSLVVVMMVVHDWPEIGFDSFGPFGWCLIAGVLLVWLAKWMQGAVTKMKM